MEQHTEAAELIDNDDDAAAAADDFDNVERMLMQPPNINVDAAAAPSSSNNHRRKPSPAFTPRRAGSFVSDNDMDNKSHVSELTEDRTQREFAAILGYHHHHHQHQHHDAAPPPPDAPLMRGASPRLSKRQQEARYRLRQQEKHFSSSPRVTSLGPPSVIIGVKKNDDNDDDDRVHTDEDDDEDEEPPMDNELDDHHHEREKQSMGGGGSASISRPLDTISSSGHVSNGGTTPPMPRRQPLRDGTSVSSVDRTESSAKSKPLSVAQRARMDADLQASTPVRARLDEKSLSSLKQRNSSSNKLNDSFSSVISGRSQSPAPRQQRVPAADTDGGASLSSSRHQQSTTSGGLWKRMEEAVLGPARDSDYDDESSYESTRVTDYTDDDRGQRDGAKRRFARDRHDAEEKKSSDSVVSISVSQWIID